MKNLIPIDFLLFLVIPFILCSSCDTTPLPPASDYIIFGDFYGECAGPKCVNIYKIVDGQIFKDTTHKYPLRTSYYSGKWIKLPNEMLNFVNDSIYNIPAELIEEKANIIGEPDSRDQGGFYLEIYRNENYKHIQLFWLIDTDLNNVPNYLHNYLRTLESVIDSLKNNS
jgi:hypothetical protein